MVFDSLAKPFVLAIMISTLIWYRTHRTTAIRKTQDRLHVIHDETEQCDADIVAVHGLGSTPETTWNYKLQEGQKVMFGPMWLQDFLPKENLRARIMVFNHNSGWMKNATLKSLEDHGNDLLCALDRKRGADVRRRPIIFIGHSFGGIVIKQALYNALRSDVNDWRRQIAEDAKGFVFLGTPHQGSSMTALGQFLALLNRWRGSNDTLLKAIQPGSSVNQRIHESFIQTYPVKQMVVCFFEAELMRVFGIPLFQVVSKDSARIENADCFGFETNHQNLQRFSSIEDEGYQTLVHYLRKYIGNATTNTSIAEAEREVTAGDSTSTLLRLPIVPQESHTEPRGRGPRNPYFFGRKGLIIDLHQHVKPYTQDGSGKRTKVCVLHGVGGAGKTQIANEYTYQYWHEYEHIFWIQAEDPAEMARAFSSIATELSDGIGSQSDQQLSIGVTRTRLSKSVQPWLLVFDNVISKDALHAYLPEGTSGSIIITTQCTEVKDMWPSRIQVHPLDVREGAGLLLHYLNPPERLAEIGVDDKIEDAQMISTILGGLPIAIAVAAGFISTSKCALSDFIADFGHPSSTFFADWCHSHGPFTAGYARPIKDTLEIALQDLAPKAKSLLDCLSFMDPDHIQESMVFRVHNYPSLEFLSTTNPARVRLLQQNIYRRYLVNKRHNQGQENYLYIPPDVKSYIQGKLLGDFVKYNEAFTRATLLIRTAFPRQDPGASPTNYRQTSYAKYFIHLLSLHAAYKEALRRKIAIDPPIEFGQLLSDLVKFMYTCNLKEVGIEILETARDVFSKTLAPDIMDQEQIQVLSLRASLELSSGITKRAQGVIHHKEVVRLRLEQLDRMRHGDNTGSREAAQLQIATAYNDLACAYMHCDDYTEAESLLRKTIDITGQLPGNCLLLWLPNFAETNMNRALIALVNGDGDMALNWANEAVALIERWGLHGPTTMVGLLMRFMHACVLFNIGSRQEALDKNLDILSARIDFLGHFHEHTIDSYYAVGMIYFSLGMWESAESMLQRCLQIRTEYHESRIPRVLYCLSRVLAHRNDTGESTMLLDDARRLFQHLLPDEPHGMDLSDPDEMVQYDQIVSIWSGRFTGKLNLDWQRQRR